MEDFESKVRERINKLLQMEGLTQTEFAKKVEVNPTNFNQVLLGKRHVQKDLPTKVIEAFPEIRIEWLLYGQGEMYKKDQHLFDKTKLQEHMAMLPTRPRLPKFYSEGTVDEYYKGAKRPLCTERPLIYNLSDYDFSLILKNNRMSPKYERGDEVFFKETQYIQKNMDPEWGEEFLLDTDNGLKFKRIYPDTDKNGAECFRCVAYNREEYPDFLIPRSIVHGIYRCVGSLRIK